MQYLLLALKMYCAVKEPNQDRGIGRRIPATACNQQMQFELQNQIYQIPVSDEGFYRCKSCKPFTNMHCCNKKKKKDKVYTKMCQIHLSLWSLLTQSHSVILWEWCWMVTWLWLPPLLQASGRPQPFAGFSALSDPIPRHRVGFQPPGSLEHCNKCCSHVYQALLAFLPLWWSAINTVPFHPASPWHLLWVPWCLRGVVAHQIPQLSCAVHPQDASPHLWLEDKPSMGNLNTPFPCWFYPVT